MRNCGNKPSDVIAGQQAGWGLPTRFSVLRVGLLDNGLSNGEQNLFFNRGGLFVVLYL